MFKNIWAKNANKESKNDREMGKTKNERNNNLTKEKKDGNESTWLSPVVLCASAELAEGRTKHSLVSRSETQTSPFKTPDLSKSQRVPKSLARSEPRRISDQLLFHAEIYGSTASTESLRVDAFDAWRSRV